MTDDRTFFEIAAALLPALMLGGLFSDGLKPRDDRGRGLRWPYWAILVGGTAFVVAETFAIRAAITGEPATSDRVVVSAALIVAAIGSVLLILVPWLERLPRDGRGVHTIPLLIVLVCLGVFATIELNRAIDISSVQEETEEAGRQLLQLEAVVAQRARAEREKSRLEVRTATLMARRPRPPDYRGRLFFLNDELRSINLELKGYNQTYQRIRDELVRLYG